MTPGIAREIALGILLRVDEEGAWASRLLESLDEKKLDPRDLALVHEIVLGVERWRGTLDHVLGRFSRTRIEDLEPSVREALRIGAYQLLYLDRIPDHAAVNGSVELARRASGRGAAGLVNAVLRKLAGSGERRRTAAPGSPSGPSLATAAARGSTGTALVQRLGAELSHPEWMIERAVSRLGEEEARAWLLSNNETPPISLRPNPLHPAFEKLAELLLEEGVVTRPGTLAPGALQVIEGRAARTGLFAAGGFWIQDEASQIVPLLFPPPWSGLSADLCAAPGGKTFVLATAPFTEGLEGRGVTERVRGTQATPATTPRVVALDLHTHRLVRLLEMARRIAPERIAAVAADLSSGPPLPSEIFDRVLVDAPCSGTGVLRRHPEIRWRLRPERIAELASLQSRLLDTALALLRPGGHLVYSVCSVEPEEGDDVLDRFLGRSRAALVDPRPYLPSPAKDAVGQDWRLRTFTHRHGSDGFFAAIVRKPLASGGP